MTTYVRKFTQFDPGNVDSPVGVSGGANTIGPISGSGGASITYTFTQAAAVVPPLYLGAAVRVDVASTMWECTLGTTALLAEFYAFIVDITGDDYTVQFAGVVPDGTPFLTGLAPGTPFYLSDTVPGGITDIPSAVDGEINLPVLWAMDNGNSVIKMSRGFVNGSVGTGGGGGSANNVATVTQPGNTFALGDALYMLADQTFELANAYTTLAASQAEWMVTGIVNPGVSFTIQQGGKVQGLVTVDDVGAAIVSGPTYYISPIPGMEGKLTSTNPTSPGLFSRPFYVQQVQGSNTGWLLDQRSVAGPVASANASPWVFLGVLNDANNYSDANILVGPDGETYKAYKIIVNSGPALTDTGIGATGPNPIGIGFRFAIAGVFITAVGSYASYITGVNSSAGINTATMWANVANNLAVVGRDFAMIVPPTSDSVGLVSGDAILSVSVGRAVLTGNFFSIDGGTTPGTNIGYTSMGWAAMGAGATPVTGMEVHFSGVGATLTPGGDSYISIFGIPNS